MIMMPAIEAYVSSDLTRRVIDHCWDLCYDSEITRDMLIAGRMPDDVRSSALKCQKRCVGRSFEVMKLQMIARERREKEQALGMQPFELDKQQHPPR